MLPLVLRFANEKAADKTSAAYKLNLYLPARQNTKKSAFKKHCFCIISPANLGDCSPDSAPHNVLPDILHLDGAGQCIGLIHGCNKH